MSAAPNRFVMVDGLDGSGKGTIVNGFADWARSQNLRVLDVREYCKTHNTYPSREEVKAAQVIVSGEPSYCYVGKAIREELISTSASSAEIAKRKAYCAQSIAQAFSLDREILYRRVILPALEAGSYVFQERGVISSVVYQPLQQQLPLQYVLELPGNKLAFENAPSLLIITKVSAETVIKRLDSRAKKDNSIFENLEFQRKLEEGYSSVWLKELFEKQGSSVRYIDTNPPKTEKESVQEAVSLLKQFFSLSS